MKFYLLTMTVILSVCSLTGFANTQTLSVKEKLSKLEVASGGRLGLSAINTGNNQHIQYHAFERFPMGCTSKVVGVAAILKQSMTNKHLLQSKVMYSKKDLTNWTPITEKHLTEGMTIEALSAAAISQSDNTAMNLIAHKVGGPSAINAFARSIGDDQFKLDHMWPDEAYASPTSTEDSTTPAAMENTLQKLAFGQVLAKSQREKLITWLQQNVTGNARIKAGVPKGWLVGDKTGSGFNYGTTNDIAIIWPPQCAPIIVTLYYSHPQKNAPKRDDLLAAATRVILEEFARNDKCIKFNTL